MDDRSMRSAFSGGDRQRARPGVDREANWPRLYGRRGRIGLLVPATNTTNEAEFALYAPEGVTTHATRTPVRQRLAVAALVEDTVERARLLLPAGCDILAYGDFTASMRAAGSGFADAVTRETGVRLITAFDAVVAALETLGARRIAVASPFGLAAVREERERLETQGFEVSAIRGLGLGETPEELARVSRIPRSVLTTLVADVMAEAGSAEALLVGCTDIPTLDFVAVLEDAYGVPVVTANQATLWCVLRSLGLDEINLSLGQLFLNALGRPRLS